MIIKINAEQPFQVLSTTFSIGPSSSGYDLMASADGVNYSKLFTVGANVNRQVTQVAAGSYYYLAGNTGNVVVNWFGNCVVDNGGGGSYVLPVASQDTLGGVKIGSGLTMSGDTLNANPGGYTLPIASENVLGGVKIGSGLTIDVNGVLSASGETYELPAATDQVLGGIKVGSGLTIDSGGTLSADIDLSGYATTAATDALSAVTSGLTEAVAGKQDTLSAGNGIDLSGSTISVKIGEGLAFSGNTIVVSGGTGGNTPRVIFLNKLTEQERIALYNELASKYDYNTQSWTSAFTQDDYAFYIDLREYNDQQAYNVNDRYEGFFPMQVNRMHPSDYGGAAFFSGVEADRVGQGILINIRFVITYDGQVDKGTWRNNPGTSPEYVFDLDITSAGTILSDANWEAIGDPAKWTRLAMRYYYDTGWEGWQAFGTAPVKWVYNYITEVDSEVKQYYIMTADININGTVYTGVWGVLQDHWYGNGDPLCPKLISWTSGSTITDPSYPPYVPNV